MTELPNLVPELPPSEEGHVDLQLLMEEANLAMALREKSMPNRVDADRLIQLSLVALTIDFLGNSEVGPTSFLNSYFIILDMNDSY